MCNIEVLKSWVWHASKHWQRQIELIFVFLVRYFTFKQGLVQTNTMFASLLFVLLKCDYFKVLQDLKSDSKRQNYYSSFIEFSLPEEPTQRQMFDRLTYAQDHLEKISTQLGKEVDWTRFQSILGKDSDRWCTLVGGKDGKSGCYQRILLWGPW